MCNACGVVQERRPRFETVGPIVERVRIAAGVLDHADFGQRSQAPCFEPARLPRHGRPADPQSSQDGPTEQLGGEFVTVVRDRDHADTARAIATGARARKGNATRTRRTIIRDSG